MLAHGFFLVHIVPDVPLDATPSFSHSPCPPHGPDESFCLIEFFSLWFALYFHSTGLSILDGFSLFCTVYSSSPLSFTACLVCARASEVPLCQLLVSYFTRTVFMSMRMASPFPVRRNKIGQIYFLVRLFGGTMVIRRWKSTSLTLRAPGLWLQLLAFVCNLIEREVAESLGHTVPLYCWMDGIRRKKQASHK